MRNKGFTLVELLIVMSIISLLVTIGVVSFRGAQLRARDTNRKADLRQFQNALEVYANAHNSFYPHQPSAVNTGVLCGNLAMTSCPDDPRPITANVHYQYITTGSGVAGDPGGINYVLYARLEGSDEYWVACSEGKSNVIPISLPITAACPI